jgi:hypothetical protein
MEIFTNLRKKFCEYPPRLLKFYETHTLTNAHNLSHSISLLTKLHSNNNSKKQVKDYSSWYKAVIITTTTTIAKSSKKNHFNEIKMGLVTDSIYISALQISLTKNTNDHISDRSWF